MERGLSPFSRACRWCGDSFMTRHASDTCCSLGCTEEVYQHLNELSLIQDEFRSLAEKVEVLHEKIYRIHRRIERQVSKLQRLGTQWAATTDGEELFAIEGQEKKISRVLHRLNEECHKRDLEAIPAERHLFTLERSVAKLKRLVGES